MAVLSYKWVEVELSDKTVICGWLAIVSHTTPFLLFSSNDDCDGEFHIILIEFLFRTYVDAV